MNHFPRWLKFLSVFIFIILLGMLVSHLVINSQSFQNWAKNKVKEKFGIYLVWDQMQFNGSTGNFEGSHLSIRSPKTKTSVTLNQFKLNFHPLKLFIGKVELLNIEAENLIIELDPNKTNQTPNDNSIHSDPNLNRLAAFAKQFYLHRANINNIHISIGSKTYIAVKDLNLKASTPFLFYQEAGQFTARDIVFLSEKFDFFADNFMVSGAYNIVDEKKNFYPEGNGVIKFDNLLLGFNKKRTPWNPHPGWDEKLEPILEKKYLAGIPKNRTYAYVDEFTLPLTINPKKIEIKNARLNAFDGILAFSTNWNRKKGPIDFKLSTLTALDLSLLPLGKARFRESFEKLSLNLNLKGNLIDLSKNDLDGSLGILLSNNVYVPEVSNLTLSSPIKIEKGVIQFNPLTAKLDDGELKSQLSVNLHNKKLDGSVNASNLNLQSIIRLFSTLDLPGTINGNGKIGGTFLNPMVDLDLQAKEFGYENLALGIIKGNLLIEDHKLKLTGKANLKNGEGIVKLDIDELFRSSLQKLKLVIQLQHIPLQEMFASEEITGNLSGNLEFNKYRDDYEGIGSIQTNEVILVGIPIQEMKAEVKITDQDLFITPQLIKWNDQLITKNIKTTKFHFTPLKEFTIDGWLLPTVKITGQQDYDYPEVINLKLSANLTDIRFLAPLFKDNIKTLTTSGDIDLVYRFKNPLDSTFRSTLESFKLVSDIRNIELKSPTQINYQDQKLNFEKTLIQLGNYQLEINDHLAIAENGSSDLKINGKLDLSQFQDTFDWLNESSGKAEANLLLKGNLSEPKLSGKINFTNANLQLTPLYSEITEANGTINIDENRYEFIKFKGYFDDYPFNLDGWIQTDQEYKVISADISLIAEELYYTKSDSWYIQADTHIKLKGADNNIYLSGNINIVEGLYYKNYETSQFILKPIGVVYDINSSNFTDKFNYLNLDLNIKTTGELEIKNNIANLSLTGGMNLTGTLGHPIASGSINILDGTISAVGIEFESARGFISFDQSSIYNPFVSFQAIREVQDYEVRTEIKGYAQNLKLGFSSTPSLTQGDIISLIAYGRTPDQLSPENRNVFSRAAVASQLLGFVEEPLSKATKLDIVRLESEGLVNDSGAVKSRFAIGKTLSPRLSLSFIADFSDNDSINGLSFEYRLLDDLLLKGTKDTDSDYRFDIAWRFLAY